MVKSESQYSNRQSIDISTNLFKLEKWSIRRNKALLNDLFLTIENKKIVNDNDTALITNHIEPNNKFNSIFFNKTDSCIKVKDSNYFNFGLEDFTIDWWEYSLKVSTKKQQLINKRNSNKITMLVENTNNKLFSVSSDGINWDIAKERFMGTIDNKKWTHWAIIKANNVFYTFKNGLIISTWLSKENISMPFEVFTIGSLKNTAFYGYINKFRVIKNTALWAEEFKLTTDELFY